MKNRYQRILIGFTFLVTTGFNNKDTWTNLNARTWRSDSFSGSEIIFYQTVNGLRKAIFQIPGSGTYLSRATMFDVENDDDGALLKDGLDLTGRDKRVLKSRRLNLTCDSTFVLDNKIFKKKFDHLTAFNWQFKFGQADSLDIERLIGTSIDKKSIYPTDYFNN